ncbi:MAG: Transcriptional regulator, family [Verrucomicrobiales bacterium]|nr:Transcriptional regulator, family [Verrucomicrobiales bacterium]
MNLEDHFGDVIRKARAAADVQVGSAAAAAGITSAQLEEVESSGKLYPGMKVDSLASTLRLKPNKLVALSKGYHPKEQDLGQWRELRQITSEGEGMTVNAYFVWDEVSREAVLFDTGFDEKPIFQLIEENSLTLKHIFITHSHHDHVHALGAIRAKFPKTRIHSGSKNAPAEQRTRSNDFIHLGSLRITNRETPGHAEDGLTFIIGNWPEDAPHVAIVGDAIFAGSMGRGNISWQVAKDKVVEQIFSLPAETLICPGHGPVTTVEEEKANNPFF